MIESSSGEAITTFDYDPVGRLLHARNLDAEILFERDALGQVTAETCNGRMWHRIDPAGRITRRATPYGPVTNWEFDQAGQPATDR